MKPGKCNVQLCLLFHFWNITKKSTFAHLNASASLHTQFMCLSTCLFLFACLMSLKHPHIYIHTLTVHLFVSVTAPWWLLFSPSWGGDGEVMCWGSLAGWCGGEVSNPSVMFFLVGGKKSATQRKGNWRYCCQSAVETKLHEYLLVRTSLTDQTCP